MGILKYIGQVNLFKTLYANFKLFPMKTAIHFPIVVGNHVKLDLQGKVLIETKSLKPGMISIGIGGSNDLRYFNPKSGYFGIKRGGVAHFKGKAHFAVHSSLLVSDAKIVIGDNFSCNNGTKISCIEGIEIGDRCLLGTNVLIMDSDGHKIFEENNLHNNREKIRIGNHVWITAQVNILKGVTIADGVVVALGSLVVKDLTESNSIYAGNPAKLVKHNISWER